MAEMSDDEVADWIGLTQHPGWARFLAHVEAQYGAEAQIAQLDSLLEQTDGHAQHESVLMVRAIARHCRALVEWPQKRIMTLETASYKSQRPFDQLRRIGG